MIVLRGLHWISGPRDRAWQICNIDEADPTVLRTKAPHGPDLPEAFPPYLNIFRQFRPSYAYIAEPVNCKLEKDQPFHFRFLHKTRIKVLEAMRNSLFSPPSMVLPRPKWCFMPNSNVWNEQVECILLQVRHKRPAKPVENWSCSHNIAEKRMTQRLGSVLLSFRSSSYCGPILKDLDLQSDHAPRWWILNMADGTWKMATCWPCLSDFGFDNVHQTGIQGPHALSCLFNTRVKRSHLEKNFPTRTITSVRRQGRNLKTTPQNY